jgi:prevent-host-death family protein
MIRIGIRELRQHASRYLKQVKAGEIVEVTERGKLIALLVAPTPAITARGRLIASGRLIPAKGSLQLPRQRYVRITESSVSQELNELREDRLP